MDKELKIFDAAMDYDFEAVRIYAESGSNLNICNHRGHSLFTCFVIGYYHQLESDPDEQALCDLHDEYDYDFSPCGRWMCKPVFKGFIRKHKKGTIQKLVPRLAKLKYKKSIESYK